MQVSCTHVQVLIPIDLSQKILQEPVDSYSCVGIADYFEQPLFLMFALKDFVRSDST